jgi:hypothetical protein
MILVDSSVWIDYFRGAATAECDLLDRLLGSERLLTGDLILVEVLQGFRSEIAFRRALDLLGRPGIFAACGSRNCYHPGEELLNSSL